MKIAVATPHLTEKVHARFVDSFIGMMVYTLGAEAQHLVGESIEIVRVVTYRDVITFARNKLSAKALSHGVDYIFFLDDDMVFEKDLLVNLLRRKSDIVGGLAFIRSEPHQPSMYLINSDGKTYNPILMWKPKQLVACHAIGMAATLVHADVFEKMKEISQEHNDIWGFFDNENFTGEDLRFCQKAQQLGIKIFCDTSQLVGHITEKVIGYGDYYAMGEDKIYKIRKAQGEEEYVQDK